MDSRVFPGFTSCGFAAPFLHHNLHPGRSSPHPRSWGTDSTTPSRCSSTSRMHVAACLPGHVRPARKEDFWTLFDLAAKEKMNPLIGSTDNFVVFELPDGSVIACGQVRNGDPGEVSSIVVSRRARRKGVGSKILGKLVELHGAKELNLLTLDRTEKFYTSHGFERCHQDRIPAVMRAEMFLGRFVAATFAPGTELIAMVRPASKAD